ncbi:MAG: UDP-N-acetylglucosamine 1-carboxyvinyltransferase [Bacteroidales bacterium]|nr:UDP-N-acetylglucosamine 1-carboxyvinyltransferase [Bacteroidales bacterium]
MSTFIVEGGIPLKGEIHVQGAKNEALQVICATLLTQEDIIIENVPEILDVLKLHELLETLNVSIHKIDQGKFVYNARNVDISKVNTTEFYQKAAKLRGSIMVVGPLLARFGYAIIPKPGGDKIGRRHLDTHFFGFEKLGAKATYLSAESLFKVEAKKLIGTYMLLDEASVTGTANIIMASVLAQGTTTIFNAACEPYIQQLCRMLVRMGAKIEGIGSNLLTIHGVSELKGTSHKILPDMIEVGSFIGLAALTQSDLIIKNVGFKHLGIIPQSFKKLGIPVELYQDDDIHIPPLEHYEIETYMDGSILTISDAIWPGLSPDLLSIFLVVAIQAKGSVLIHQKMFESRLFFVDRLIEMGAQIILCDPHRAVVIGHNRQVPLNAIEMSSPDIRAGVALLLAALSAKGISKIHNIEQIDRGYLEIDKRLNNIGAKIKRI